MSDDSKNPVDNETGEVASAPPSNPEERAFSGHPDHPPSSPDQPLEGNEELLRRADEDAGPASEAE